MVRARATQSLILLRGLASGLQLPKLPKLEVASLRETHFISEYQNWLVPNHVMVGRYPGSGRGEWAEKAVTSVRAAGVTTFVCLQSELPPQDSGREMPRGFERYFEAATAFDGPAPSFAYYGIPDMEPAADLESLGTFVQSLADRVENDECLFVHCWGGKGRTGLVAACLLGELYDVGPEEALDRVQAYVELRAPGALSPETAAQKAQVRDYFATRHPDRTS